MPLFIFYVIQYYLEVFISSIPKSVLTNSVNCSLSFSFYFITYFLKNPIFTHAINSKIQFIVSAFASSLFMKSKILIPPIRLKCFATAL